MSFEVHVVPENSHDLASRFRQCERRPNVSVFSRFFRRKEPHPDNARKFIDYLLTSEVEQALAESEASQMPLRPGVPVLENVKRVDEIRAMKVDYAKTGALMEKLSKGYLKDWVDRNAVQ